MGSTKAGQRDCRLKTEQRDGDQLSVAPGSWEPPGRPSRNARAAGESAPADSEVALLARFWARSGSLMKSGPTPAFVLARVFALAAEAWLPVSEAVEISVLLAGLIVLC